MTETRGPETTCALLIDVRGRFLLQRRDNIPNILYPGMIGLFGGHREAQETFLECVIREVLEETGHLAPPERIEHLGNYANAEVSSQCYVIRGVPLERIVVTEGSLLIAEREDLPALTKEFSPLVAATFQMLLSKPPAV